MRLSDEEAARRLGAAPVLRLATVAPDGAPHQVPATFVWYEGPHAPRIAIAVDHKPKRHQNLRRLRNIEGQPRVCVLADQYSDDWTRLWWVRADGTARVLRGAEPDDLHGAPAAPDGVERSRALDLLAAKYPQYRARTPDGPVILIEVERLTGWAYADTPGDR